MRPEALVILALGRSWLPAVYFTQRRNPWRSFGIGTSSLPQHQRLPSSQPTTKPMALRPYSLQFPPPEQLPANDQDSLRPRRIHIPFYLPYPLLFPLLYISIPTGKNKHRNQVTDAFGPSMTVSILARGKIGDCWSLTEYCEQRNENGMLEEEYPGHAQCHPLKSSVRASTRKKVCVYAFHVSFLSC